jgi:hypothetical protein
MARRECPHAIVPSWHPYQGGTVDAGNGAAAAGSSHRVQRPHRATKRSLHRRSATGGYRPHFRTLTGDVCEGRIRPFPGIQTVAPGN